MANSGGSPSASESELEVTGKDAGSSSGLTNRAFNFNIIHENVESTQVTATRMGPAAVANVEIELDDIGEIRSTNRYNKRRVSVTPDGDAVVIRNADKSYTSGQPVLNGLNMTVPSGSIYGLLGSSGCGKTTVLSCIVGIRQLDRGKILIFGKKPGSKSTGVPGRNVGYMPQELSLYTEFSIGETLQYFGTLSGMKMEDIKTAKKMLIALMDLPDETRRVGSLSGGQQRRVSLIAALISGPELLILDEPTVGVDSLIRQNIWLHLKKLVESSRTTVIITTHYIEECRSADNIGIMRNGKLLDEVPPDELMTEYGSNNLEKIVLVLSKRDSEAQQRDSNEDENYMGIGSADGEIVIDRGLASPVKMAKVLREPNPGIKDALSRIQALTLKNFVILYRNTLLLFFGILIASLMVMLMCIAIGPDPTGLIVGLVNKEANNSVCRSLTRIPGECTVEMLSCHYLSNLKKDTLDLELFDEESDALAQIHSGHSWGYITFPANFSNSLYERIASGANPDELTLNSSEFVVKLDESNKQISNTIKKTLIDAYQDFVTLLLEDCGYDPRQGEAVLKYHNPIFGKDTTDFQEFLAPGIAFTMLFFFPIISTSIRYIKEKRSGVLHRSIVGGVKTWEIMAAYSISEFCVLLVQSLLCYTVITQIFKIQILGSDALVLILFMLSGYGGVSMGFLLGSICSEEIQAAILAMAVFFPNMILSGIIWPLEGMDVALQYVVQILPCALPAEAIRSITSRGWEFSHPTVWPGFVIVTAYIVGYFLLTVLFHVVFKR